MEVFGYEELKGYFLLREVLSNYLRIFGINVLFFFILIVLGVL